MFKGQNHNEAAVKIKETTATNMRFTEFENLTFPLVLHYHLETQYRLSISGIAIVCIIAYHLKAC